MQLRKAERKQAKLRISMAGPSGSGKTYSALLLARGLTDSWDKIALIDTENKRGDLYSQLGDYNIITLEAPFSPERFIEAIKSCELAGMEVIIIDSSSHEWEGAGGCLEINEKLAQTKFKGNTWAAWSDTTPRHQKFISAIIASPCHIITTMRSKTDTIQTEDKKIKKVGLKEIQREGFEYEMTVSFNIDRETHYAMVGKDNTQIFNDGEPFKIGVEHGQKIRTWNEGGKINTIEQKREIMRQLERIGLNTTDKAQIEADITDQTGLALIEKNYSAIIDKLKTIRPIEEQIAAAKPAATIEPDPVIPPQEEAGEPEPTVEPEKTQDELKEELGLNTPAEPTVPGDPAFNAILTGNKSEKKQSKMGDEKKAGAAKISIIRKLAQQKQNLADDAGIISYIAFIHNIEVAILEDLTTGQADKIWKDLVNQKV